MINTYNLIKNQEINNKNLQNKKINKKENNLANKIF